MTLAAYLIISAAFTGTVAYLALGNNGLYTLSKSFLLFSSLAPITILSVFSISFCAFRSVRNSGLKANLKGYFWASLSVVPETAVDLIVTSKSEGILPFDSVFSLSDS